MQGFCPSLNRQEEPVRLHNKWQTQNQKSMYCCCAAAWGVQTRMCTWDLWDTHYPASTMLPFYLVIACNIPGSWGYLSDAP